jgi:DNA-binding NarL/FixJ family response regulator
MLDLAAPPAAHATVPRGVPPNGRTLTGREVQVLDLLGRGLRDRDIAEALGISVRTVEKHVEHIFRKLRAHNRLDAVRLARPLRPTG